MILNSINIQGLSEALAWTLLHSLWQAALIAGIVAVVFRLNNKNNARLRYAMASLGLLLIFISAALTFLLAYPEKTLVHHIQASGVAQVVTDTQETVFSWDWLKSYLPTHILFPILLRTWIAGVLFFSIKMLVNYINALRLKNHMAFALNEKYSALAQALLKRFKIKKKVTFRESALVDSPSLIGYFKPVVLLPICLLSGIPDNQLEIIIAHELAHIRRHDYLIQFIQGIFELLFFYHPLVWWLSSVVNTEREHICDDIAVKFCGESLTLIKALKNMEVIRKKQHELVLNFSGKKANLLHRVRRILNPQVVTHPKLERSLLSAVFVFALSGLILFSNLANSKNQVKVETQNTNNLSIGDPDNNQLWQAAAINPSLQKKKLKKDKSTLTPVKDLEKVAKPVEPCIKEVPAVPEVPDVPEVEPIISDTLVEVEELIEIQEDALKDALQELDSVNVNISTETLKELEMEMKELESFDFDFDVDIEKELQEAEFEIQKEFDKLENPQDHDSFKRIDDNKKLSEKEKAELKARIKASLERVNSEEFRQEIRENLECARENMKEHLEKIKSGEFKKQMELQKEKIKEMIKKFESPEYQKELKENLERSREHIEKHLEKLKSPEYRKELERKIEEYKKKKRDTLSHRGATRINTSDNSLFILDGKEISKEDLDKISPERIESISVLKDEDSKTQFGAKAKNGVVLIRTKDRKGQSNQLKAIRIKDNGKLKNNPLYVINGKKISSKNIPEIDPNLIESMDVLKGEKAVAMYGKAAKNGVIVIKTKNSDTKELKFNDYLKSN